MSLQWIEGFENDQAATDLQRKYSIAIGNYSFVTGRFLGKALQADDDTGCTFETPALSSHGTWIFGCSLYNVTTITGPNPLFVSFKSGGSSQVTITVDRTSSTQGVVIAKRGATTLGTSTTISLTDWTTFEFKVTIHGSTGTVDVRVNGVSVLSLTGQNTANAGGTTADSVSFVVQRGASGSGSAYIDDIYICNGSGSIRNNFLGTCVVEGLTPNADGSSSQWTPFGGGAHYTEVDEQNVDDDTSYIETPDNAKKDMFGFSNLAFINGNILGVQVNSQAKVSVAGSRTFSHMFRDTGLGTENQKTAKTVSSTTYDHFFDIWEQNPQSSADFTVSDINNGEFGVLSVS